MGLGLHGGGLASVRFLARRGARVTVTDNRSDPSVFADVLPELESLGVRTILGRHEERDFAETELVVKNPAVPDTSQFLALARERGVPVETDLSLFLRLSANPVVGITGSKGKSTAAAAAHFCFLGTYPGARLGGNITVSPLSFLDELEPDDPVVLELSSWQLADLRGRGVLDPVVAVLTVILRDHQDRYPGMDAYVKDKSVLIEGQSAGHFAVLNRDDPWQTNLPPRTRARVLWTSARPLPEGLDGGWDDGDAGWIRVGGRSERLLGARVSVPGRHSRLNLRAAGLAARLFGQEAGSIERRLAQFPGLEHRLELVRERRGVRYYNDSAATIPEAAAAALESLPPPVYLIAGGTDKNLDFGPLAGAARRAAGLILLAGTGTRKLRVLLDAAGAPYQGPFDSLAEAVERAADAAPPGSSVVLSPGCTSFGMFLNEFDRGRRFKALVEGLP
jgi:UDP-N-acetylmuramoylalanine--D-glutamate ligase